LTENSPTYIIGNKQLPTWGGTSITGNPMKGRDMRDVMPAIGFRPVGDCAIFVSANLYIEALKGG